MKQDEGEVPVWVELTNAGGAPACRAFKYAFALLKDWIDCNPDSVPPLVIHLTRGIATDGNEVRDAQSLCGLQTSNGHTVLFQGYFADNTEDPAFLIDDACPILESNPEARTLFQCASPIHPFHQKEFEYDGFQLKPRSRWMVFNDFDSKLLEAYFTRMGDCALNRDDFY